MDTTMEMYKEFRDHKEAQTEVNRKLHARVDQLAIALDTLNKAKASTAEVGVLICEVDNIKSILASEKEVTELLAKEKKAKK